MSVALRHRLEGLGYVPRPRAPRATSNLDRVAASLGGEVRVRDGDPMVVIEDIIPAPVAADDRPALATLGHDLPSATMCFLDTETTGLSGGVGTQAFLCALAWRVAGGVLVRQYLLPDPAYESAMLSAITDDVAASTSLVSYNGRTFDAPLLETRMLMCRLDPLVMRRPHLDLLHPVRRIFRSRLASCSLGSVEYSVLGRDRGEDIPGFLIPAVYFDHLRSGETEGLRAVLAHNRQDVVSLSLLLDHVCALVTDPRHAHPLDRFGLAGLLDGAGRLDDALGIYASLWAESEDGWNGEAWPGAWSPVELAYVVGLRLAVAHRRAGRPELARPILEHLCDRHPRPVEAGIMLAKHLEHRGKDPRAALEVTRAALEAFSRPHHAEASPRRGRVDPNERWLADLTKRQSRLSGRVRGHAA